MSSKNVICNALPYIVSDVSKLPPNPPIQQATPRPYEAFDLLLSAPNTDLPKGLPCPIVLKFQLPTSSVTSILTDGGDFNNDFNDDFSIEAPTILTIPNTISANATYTAIINNVPYVIYQSPQGEFAIPGWYLVIWYLNDFASFQYAFYISPQ